VKLQKFIQKNEKTSYISITGLGDNNSNL